MGCLLSDLLLPWVILNRLSLHPCGNWAGFSLQGHSVLCNGCWPLSTDRTMLSCCLSGRRFISLWYPIWMVDMFSRLCPALGDLCGFLCPSFLATIPWRTGCSCILCWGICHHDCLDWGVTVSTLAVAWRSTTKAVHQHSWMNSSSLKGLAGDLYVCFNQNWRGCEWSLARGRLMLAQLFRPSSLTTSLNAGDKATLNAWNLSFVPFPWCQI